MPGLFGGGGAPGAQTGSQVTPGGGLGGAASSGGLGMLNPYFSQLGPQEQKAAALRMAMANMGEMDFQGGVNAQQRPRTYGLGQLDAVVNESYDRAEREKAWMARERSEKQSEERYLTQQEQYEKRQEQDRRDRMREAKEQMEREKRAQEQQAWQRERMQQQREEEQRQMQDRQRLAGLSPKIAQGQATPEEQVEYANLQGRYPPPPNPWDQFNQNNPLNNLMNQDDEIYRYGVGRVQR